MNEAILFLNGKIDLEFCDRYIQDYLSQLAIYCADGAYIKVKESSVLYSKVKMAIGDFDSGTNEENDMFLVDNDQETTDFEKCLNYLTSRKVSKIYVFGASEGEMDHFLGNISIAMMYRGRVSIEFVDKHSRYFFIPKQYTINNVYGKMLSLMPLSYAENVHLKGLEYPLRGENLSIGSRIGIRNYAVNDVVDISYAAGDVLLFVSHNKYKDR
tara:strand:+ start:185 stop:823 length:639 start_codon:yes stop_codon:yes gene_type:complete